MTSSFQYAETAGAGQRAFANYTAPKTIAMNAVPTLQRKQPEDEELQMKSIPEDALLQKKENPATPKINKTGMPDNLKTGIENLSGFSMDDVKVHYNSDKPAQLNALAYAQGTDIHVAPGQERHLPHEAWHIVQQKQGRVQATIQAKGVAINDDRGLEREADVMGGEAMRLFALASPKHGKVSQLKMGINILTNQPIQRIIRGGAREVYFKLEKNKKYKEFIANGSKQSKGYLKALGKMLDELNAWESGFNSEDIADAIRLSEFSAEGVKGAKAIVVRQIEERIDEEILTEGHSGERHYGKDADYQRKRLTKEKKAKVTTIEDSRAAQKFFTIIKQKVHEDLLSVIHDIIFDLGLTFEHLLPTIKGVKEITEKYVGRTSEFENFKIIMETISVKNGGAGVVNVIFKPKLESLGTFKKTAYTVDNSSEEWESMLLYWGRNSPQISVRQGINYAAYYEELDKSIVNPVTAF